MDFLDNNIVFRTVPRQSGVFQIDLSINQTTHNSDIEISLSGGGSRFFAFGANSGNYFASGNSKLFYQATSPDTNITYSFVLGSNTYDVYDRNGLPLMLGISKPTGVLEKVYTRTSSGAEGSFSLLLKGQKPDFVTSGALVFPVINANVDSLDITNLSDVEFSVLSGSFPHIFFISGASNYPILVKGNETKQIKFSGALSNINTPSVAFTLNTDYLDIDIPIPVSGTYYSGSGYTFTTPSSASVTFGQMNNVSFSINNTGTEAVRFQPQITRISRGVSIALPSYSGVNIANFFSGYFDTPSQFFFSDNIIWQSGEFNIIHQNQTGIKILNITGESSITGLFLGSETAQEVGQTFVFPYDVTLTGYALKLAVTGGAFSASDAVYTRVLEGQGLTGSVLAFSNFVPCTSISSGIANGSYVDFALPLPTLLKSGNYYTISLSGNPTWVGVSSASPNRKVILLQNTGDVYSQGSGFSYSGTTTFSGDAILKIESFPPTGANRYFTSRISGNYSRPSSVSTGTYSKYVDDKSFNFALSEITAEPNQLTYFTMTYTGIVSGLNMANLKFLNTNYNQIISGFTS